MRPTLITLAILLAGCASGHLDRNLPPGYTKTAPVFKGMGDHDHPISTDVPLAQEYFNQGLTLAFGFNHAEAARSFREVQKLDPDHPMGYWGEAYVLGPNINAVMSDQDVPSAWDALSKAKQYAPNGTERESAYVQALAPRYGPEPVKDRSDLDQAYADAMGQLAANDPDDLDAACLHAEALMDTTPWDYWEKNQQPKPHTRTILSTLERVLREEPNHAFANHLYIHAVEAVEPQRAAAAADRLGKLVPGAGHLVHMPSHIYIRIGRYQDGAVANERAIAADNDYVVQCHAQGLYPLAYMPHNHHFLWACATMAGRSRTALGAAEHTGSMVDRDRMGDPGLAALQHFSVMPLYAKARFGKWDQLLAEPRPSEDLPYPRAVWHYGRGMAMIRTDRVEEAAAEWKSVRDSANDPALAEQRIFENNSLQHVLKIAEAVLAGELADARGDLDGAVAHLRRGVQLEDDLYYDEPSPWYFPVRQALGAVLLEAGQAAEAEKVYRQDLGKFPDNGWSLYGLQQSLAAQGKTGEAGEVKQQFERAWAHADVELSSSRF